MADFSQNRSVFIRIFFIAIPVIIVIRLLFLQVFSAGGYKEAAQGQQGLPVVVEERREDEEG